ncbi:MAG: MarR family transcriptional regulator [Thermoleophilia bacterium]
MSLFLRIVNKYNAMEKLPVAHGKTGELYHSERHMLDAVAANTDLNITEHAAVIGVTKGAISQIAKKLEEKGFVRRYKKGGNDKEVYLELTGQGRKIAESRKQLNEETMKPLLDELSRHSAKEVDFLVTMFRWMDGYFDESRKQMEAKAAGH